jgi:type VI secretion system secreted protein VgrG
MSTLVRRPRSNRSRCRPQIDDLEHRTLLAAELSPVPLAIGDPGGGSAAPYDALIGASATRAAYQVDGSGLAAAVIDTGVDYHHPALGGGFGPGYKVSGYDLANKDGDPDTTWTHGTMVAGIIASSDPANPGIAPGARIVALRVFTESGNSSFDLIADGLQWVLDHYQEENISVVNVSLSDGGNYPTDGGWTLLAVGRRIMNLVNQLAALGIPVVAGAGNSFDGSSQGMGFAAIVRDTLSVTGSTSSDAFLPNAQRLGPGVGGASATDLLAPGQDIPAPSEGTSFTTASGTSFSTAIVSGSVLLLQSIYKSRFGVLPTVAQVTNWLKAGGRMVTDTVTGVSLPRIDLQASAALIPSPPVQAAPAPPPPVATTPTPTPNPAPATPPQIAPAPAPAPAPDPAATPAPGLEPAPPAVGSSPPRVEKSPRELRREVMRVKIRQRQAAVAARRAERKAKWVAAQSRRGIGDPILITAPA